MSREDPRLGWIPDLPDHRDFLFAAPPTTLASLPSHADLTAQFPRPPYDQGQLGSCTGNGIAGAIEFERAKQKLLPDFIPSRLFIYYNERSLEHTVNSDAGAMIRDGIKSVNKQGVCTETSWPYDGDPSPDNGGTNTVFSTKPSAACYTEAKLHKVVSYLRLTQDLNQMKGCIAAGYPFVFGFSCYESIFNPTTGTTGDIPLPASTEKMIGGHCIVAVGYDDSRQVFLIRNSWGTTWGKGGYGSFPYAYISNASLASDFWTVRGVSS